MRTKVFTLFAYAISAYLSFKLLTLIGALSGTFPKFLLIIALIYFLPRAMGLGDRVFSKYNYSLEQRKARSVELENMGRQHAKYDAAMIESGGLNFPNENDFLIDSHEHEEFAEGSGRSVTPQNVNTNHFSRNSNPVQSTDQANISGRPNQNTKTQAELNAAAEKIFRMNGMSGKIGGLSLLNKLDKMNQEIDDETF